MRSEPDACPLPAAGARSISREPLHKPCSRRGAWTHREAGIGIRPRPDEHEIEDNMRIAAAAVGRRQQTFARTEGEVVAGKRVVSEIDLRCQRAIAWRLDEEMHVRRTVAMAAERLHQDVGRAPRRHAVAVRHDRSERVAAISAELEAAAVVECGLLARRIKMRVKALWIGMPDMEDRRRNGLTVRAAHPRPP